MYLSEQDLLDIVASASTIAERLGNEFIPNSSKSDDIINARLDAWCQAIAKGNRDEFRKRLAWDGLNIDIACRALGPVQLRQGTTLPIWADILREVLNVDMVLAGPGSEIGQASAEYLRFLDPQRPLPFEEIMIPFVIVAWKMLTVQANITYHLLKDEAQITLQRSLLQTLTSYAAQALFLEFAIERTKVQSALGRLLTQAPDNDRTLYQHFCRQLHEGALVTFFKEYAVLARLLATTTALWIEANVEFLQRLAYDWPEIQKVFSNEGELGQVTSIQPSLSDPHHGRRSVIALTFVSGRKLVYKPKDMAIEKAYNQVLAWLNRQGVPLDFRVLEVIDRSGYGWVEFVEHESCKDQDEAQRYYRRAGILLCLIYLLEGTDCHFENIVANGQYPVLVDLETLMHHRPRFEGQPDGMHALSLAREQVSHSVLRTGLLPHWQKSNDERSAYDHSGLGATGERALSIQVPVWEHINTDRMTMEHRALKTRPQMNVPMLSNFPLRLDYYAEHVVEGFKQMYHFLLVHREALLAQDSPLQGLVHQQVRFVYRSTRVYALILRKLLNPKYLRDGADRSVQLELLGRVLTLFEGEGTLRDNGERSHWWPIFAAERQSMEQGDIPFFTAHASRDALVVGPCQEIEGCLREPSFSRVIARLKVLGNENLERQVGFIYSSLYLYSQAAHSVDHVPTATRASAGANADAHVPLASEALVAQAVTLAEQIARQAIRASDGSVAWIAPQYVAGGERYQLQAMGYDLYAGTSGVAMFLAALERVTGMGYRALALDAIRDLRRALQEKGGPTDVPTSIGGGSGLGSLIYTLVRVSQFLNESVLLQDARQAASLITDDHIINDKALDVIAGAAGAILGLLALYDALPDQTILDRAIACGHHLLHMRSDSRVGYRAWATINGKLASGFSHGAAGITYALLRLYQVTRNPDFLAAAEEGIAYEDSLFSPEVGNWLDLRAEEQPAFMTTWCHGAPGIGLARIGGISVCDTAQVRGDIETAIQTTQRFGIQGPDHVCCGNLGRAEVLLVAASRLSRSDMLESARKQVSQVVSNAEQTSFFRLYPILPETICNPGFFHGIAGIGYTLLRAAHPEVLPSVLLWE